MIHCDQVGGLALSDARVSNMAISGEDTKSGSFKGSDVSAEGRQSDSIT